MICGLSSCHCSQSMKEASPMIKQPLDCAKSLLQLAEKLHQAAYGAADDGCSSGAMLQMMQQASAAQGAKKDMPRT